MPSPEHVHVFIAEIGAFSHEMCLAILSKEDRARLENMADRRRGRQFALGRYLLREALHILYGQDAEFWQLPEHGVGKPRLVGAGAPEFSLSHAHERVVCAIAERPVGVDIEYMKERDFPALTRFIATDAEWRDFQKLDSRRHKERFYQLWLLKEATYKALGQDIEMTSLGFDLAGPPTLVTHPAGLDDIDLNLFTCEPGYSGVLAVLGAGTYRVVRHSLVATR